MSTRNVREEADAARATLVALTVASDKRQRDIEQELDGKKKERKNVLRGADVALQSIKDDEDSLMEEYGQLAPSADEPDDDSDEGDTSEDDSDDTPDDDSDEGDTSEDDSDDTPPVPPTDEDDPDMGDSDDAGDDTPLWLWLTIAIFVTILFFRIGVNTSDFVSGGGGSIELPGGVMVVLTVIYVGGVTLLGWFLGSALGQFIQERFRNSN